MAVENFIHDLSEYLVAGNLSDLTLVFGERKWAIHKALACCHSKWFHNAVTSGFQESESNVITLHDEPEFENAIDCMVSYFYKAAYVAATYEGISKCLLHAQVATIADKYDCPSLSKLASGSFINSAKSVAGEDWIAIASFVYGHTTADVAAHRVLRSSLVDAITRRPSVLKAVLDMEDAKMFLRSNADLATDLLLQMPVQDTGMKIAAQSIFACGRCRYTHVGPVGCTYVTSRRGSSYKDVCPECAGQSEVMPIRRGQRTFTVGWLQSSTCHDCGGLHTNGPQAEPAPVEEPVMPVIEEW